MKPSNAYLSRQIETASPAERVAMLHERAIGCLREAIQAIQDGDIQRRWKNNNRAVEIIETLWVTLDLERGGEIAANLDRLYGFMLNHLTGVDLRNDPKPANDVIGLLEPLRQSWRELANRDQHGAAPDAAAAAQGTADTLARSAAPAGEEGIARVKVSA